MDLFPGVGSIGFGMSDRTSSLPFAIQHVEPPFFRPPTTDANLTVAMAAIFLVMSLFWALRYNGVWGFIKHIFGVKMDANKWLYPDVFAAVHFHRRDGIDFDCVRPAAGAGDASLRQHFWRRERAD